MVAHSHAFLLEAEAAELLRLSPRTLQRLRQEGGGPRFRRLGARRRGRIVYAADDLIAWADARAVSSTSEPAR